MLFKSVQWQPLYEDTKHLESKMVACVLVALTRTKHIANTLNQWIVKMTEKEDLGPIRFTILWEGWTVS